MKLTKKLTRAKKKVDTRTELCALLLMITYGKFALVFGFIGLCCWILALFCYWYLGIQIPRDEVVYFVLYPIVFAIIVIGYISMKIEYKRLPPVLKTANPVPPSNVAGVKWWE